MVLFLVFPNTELLNSQTVSRNASVNMINLKIYL